MKKIILLITIVLALSVIPSAAEDEITVLIPDYDFILDTSSIYYFDSIYPILSYKDVTYFPMTYDYMAALKVSSSWVEGEGLFIAAHPKDYYMGNLPIYETTQNPKYNKATLVTYPVYVNGVKINNSEAEYPLFNFRGITYFPLTYDYATEDFYWDIDFSEKDGRRTLTVKPYFRGFGSSMIIVAETPDYAIIRGLAFGDEGFFRVDYKTDEITKIEPFEYKEGREFIMSDRKLEIKDNRFVLDGQVLSEISVLASGTTSLDDSKASYTEYEENGLHFITLSLGYHYSVTQPPYIPYERHTYIVVDDSFIRVTDNSYVEKAVKIGDDVYVSSLRYTGWKGNTFLHKHLHLCKISPDGGVTYINDLFPDFNSVELIGEANGKVYLKCLWMPEEYAISLSSNNYSVSPYNDGYYSFDGEKLTLLRRYIYSDKAFVSPEGKIYITNEQFGIIKRIY